MMSSTLPAQGRGLGRGDSTPCSAPYPFLRRLGVGGGEGGSRGLSSVLWAQRTQHNPVPGFSEHFLVPPFQWVAVKIALGLS